MCSSVLFQAEVDESQIQLQGLSRMPAINGEGHLFSSKLECMMDTTDEQDMHNGNGNPVKRRRMDEEVGKDVKMRYKCYILPPIKYPDGELLLLL